ncbi:MAG: type I methionyl aminopeptidase [Candidatus Omnitrophota bacterium]
MVALKSPQEIEIMRLAGQILKSIFQKIKAYIIAGRTTEEIDRYAGELISEHKGATAAFKGYKGFPANMCISINEEVVHGIPSAKKIKSGDIVSSDIGICYRGYFADSACTLPIGPVNPAAKKLIRVAHESLWQGIKQARPGKYLGDISYAIQRHAESSGFSIVRQFVGHGIGRNLQEEPEVPNFGRPHQGLPLMPGMVLAIEPMVNAGTWEVEVLDDNWTVVTKDKQQSAHFEHTVAITEADPEVLT